MSVFQSLKDMGYELADDVGDFYDIAKTRGMGEAVTATKDKLFGVEAPKTDDEWTTHADGALQTRSPDAGITEFKEESGPFGKWMDPNSFTFGGGASKDQTYRDEDGTRDIAFAGRPGEYDDDGMLFGGGGGDKDDFIAFDYEEDGHRSGLFENEETFNKRLRWMSPGEDGRGLTLSEGERPDGALTQLKKIYDLSDELELYNTKRDKHINRKESGYYEKENEEYRNKPKPSWAQDDGNDYYTPYTKEDLEWQDKQFESFSNYSNNQNWFTTQDTYNLALADEAGNIKNILNMNKKDIDDNNKEKGVNRVYSSIIKALEQFEADEVYYLDAGGNRRWQHNLEADKDFDYVGAYTIGGTHKQY